MKKFFKLFNKLVEKLENGCYFLFVIEEKRFNVNCYNLYFSLKNDENKFVAIKLKITASKLKLDDVNFAYTFDDICLELNNSTSQHMSLYYNTFDLLKDRRLHTFLFILSSMKREIQNLTLLTDFERYQLLQYITEIMCIVADVRCINSNVPFGFFEKGVKYNVVDYTKETITLIDVMGHEIKIPLKGGIFINYFSFYEEGDKL